MKPLFIFFSNTMTGVKEGFKVLFLTMLFFFAFVDYNPTACGFAYIEHLQMLRNAHAPKIPGSFLACEDAIKLLKEVENEKKGIKPKTFTYAYSPFKTTPEISQRDTLLTTTIQQKIWQDHRARISLVLYNN